MNSSEEQPRPGDRRRDTRRTIVCPAAEIFDGLGVQNMPLPEFEEMARLIAGHFGITVGENKRTLVTGRMYPMLEKYGFANHRECLDAIERDASGRLLSELADRVSTNHTAFYREEPHFSMLRETVLPEAAERKKKLSEPDLRARLQKLGKD